MLVFCSLSFSSFLEIKSLKLTLVKACKERSIIFPTVSVNCFCDLNIINNRRRLSVDFKSYHLQL